MFVFSHQNSLVYLMWQPAYRSKPAFQSEMHTKEPKPLLTGYRYIMKTNFFRHTFIITEDHVNLYRFVRKM